MAMLVYRSVYQIYPPYQLVRSCPFQFTSCLVHTRLWRCRIGRAPSLGHGVAQRCSVAPNFQTWSKKSASKVSFRWFLLVHLDSNNILKPKQCGICTSFFLWSPQHKLFFSSCYVQLELDMSNSSWICPTRVGQNRRVLQGSGSVSALVQGIFKTPLDDIDAAMGVDTIQSG